MKYLDFVPLLILLASVKCDICPSGDECPDDYTCCPFTSGYGCCHLPHAVCCSDLEHCCPQDYICDYTLRACVKGPFTQRKYLNTTSTKQVQLSQPNVCPGGQEQCPEGKTCCPLRGGIFGCCPMPNAVCCSDKMHCCPSGYTCDAAGQCLHSYHHTYRFAKTISKRSKLVSCPDGNHCFDGDTCCKMADGEYRCCPSGMHCDVITGACSGAPVLITSTVKLPATKGRSLSIRQVNRECPDHGHCRNVFTCCPMGGGRYGCCPFPEATCCSNLLHCCPHGMICNISEGGRYGCTRP